MAKATRPKVVTLRPGNGQTIRVETDPARDEAFRAIETRLQGAKCALACATLALTHSDAAASDEGVAHVESLLFDVLETIRQVQGGLDRFSLDHLSKTRGVAS